MRWRQTMTTMMMERTGCDPAPAMRQPSFLRAAGLLALAAWVANLCAGEDFLPLPFAPGERLTYHLGWGFVPVGSAVLEVVGPVDFEGISAYELRLSVRTNGFADKFYRVRDEVRSLLSSDLGRSLFYTQQQQEGRHQRDIRVSFDWKESNVVYTNHGESQDPVAIPRVIFDPLSVVYAARLLGFERYDPLVLPVTDGKKVVEVMIRLGEQARLKTKAGIYPSVLVEPDTKDLGGIFRKSPKARIRIWFSDDENRLPVRFKSRVVVGSFWAELVDYLPGSWAGSRPRVGNPLMALNPETGE